MPRKHVFNALVLATGLVVAQAPSVTLKWGAQNDILSMDPHSQNHATTLAILMNSYEGLTRYGPKFEVEPALATKWTYVTPTQVCFDLRKGVKFHDGSAFTADDVIFSFNRIRQPQGFLQVYVSGINETKKIDDNTVDVILAAPNPTLLRSLIDFRIAQRERYRPVPRHELAAGPENHDGNQQVVVGQGQRQCHRRGLHAHQV